MAKNKSIATSCSKLLFNLSSNPQKSIEPKSLLSRLKLQNLRLPEACSPVFIAPAMNDQGKRERDTELLAVAILLSLLFSCPRGDQLLHLRRAPKSPERCNNKAKLSVQVSDRRKTRAFAKHVRSLRSMIPDTVIPDQI